MLYVAVKTSWNENENIYICVNPASLLISIMHVNLGVLDFAGMKLEH